MINKMDITFQPVTRHNWEEMIKLKVHEHQIKFVPSAVESLAFAYIKPWDEALDPYIIFYGEVMVGAFYLSYTPQSKDNYWVGGFFIDKNHQGKGLGCLSFERVLEFVQEIHPTCEVISLTVEKDNSVAKSLYESFGFKPTGNDNQYGEIEFALRLKK